MKIYKKYRRIKLAKIKRYKAKSKLPSKKELNKFLAEHDKLNSFKRFFVRLKKRFLYVFGNKKGATEDKKLKE
ncbi:MAG: hypothetical protein GYA87_02055 [Christensenellaceae bacterium]|nr:hypothetical protein [Christensenellaceae bacterium]